MDKIPGAMGGREHTVSPVSIPVPMSFSLTIYKFPWENIYVITKWEFYMKRFFFSLSAFLLVFALTGCSEFQKHQVLSPRQSEKNLTISKHLSAMLKKALCLSHKRLMSF